MFVLFSSVKYIVTTLFVGANATLGTLYLTADFLKPVSSFPHSIAGSSDMGKFWYIAQIKKMQYEPGFVDYRIIKIWGSEAKNKVQDKFFATDIYKKCKKLKNKRYLFFNKKEINQIRDWCSLENDFLNEDLLEIFRWEFYKHCRIVWKKDPIGAKDKKEKNKYGWFLTNVLERVHKEKDKETLGKLKKLYGFWKDNIVTWSKGDAPNVGCEKPNSPNKYLPITWEDKENNWKFDSSEVADFNENFRKEATFIKT